MRVGGRRLHERDHLLLPASCFLPFGHFSPREPVESSIP